jgi:hypothetical protein
MVARQRLLFFLRTVIQAVVFLPASAISRQAKDARGKAIGPPFIEKPIQIKVPSAVAYPA